MSDANNSISKIKVRACFPCRQSKRKCDGQQPCCSCKRKIGKVCTYQYPNKPKTNIIKIHTDLINLTTQRKYIEAFHEGINPIVLFNKALISTDMYDQPSTLARKLQMNAILACSTRAFGAPNQIYDKFEKKARDTAKKLMTNFTYETALGFNYLAYYYWGKDELLSSHYRDMSFSICDCALRIPKNAPDRKKLVKLRLGSTGIYEINDGIQIISSIVPNDLKDDEDIRIIEQWAITHCENEFLFAYEPIDNFNTLDIEKVNSKLNHMNKIRESWKHGAKSPSLTLVYVCSCFLQAIIFNATGDRKQSLEIMNCGIKILLEKTYLIGMGGPQFNILLHTCFYIAVWRGDFVLAHRVNNVQEKLAAIFPSAIQYFSEDEKYLKDSFFDSSCIDKNAQLNYSCPVSGETSAFNWMSNVPLPVISPIEQTQCSPN